MCYSLGNSCTLLYKILVQYSRSVTGVCAVIDIVNVIGIAVRTSDRAHPHAGSRTAWKDLPICTVYSCIQLYRSCVGEELDPIQCVAYSTVYSYKLGFKTTV